MTEKEFSKHIAAAFQKSGYYVTKIESHGTQPGIPDLFVVGHGYQMWIELKVIENQEANGDIKVPWRPWQQAWAMEYKTHMIINCSLTMVWAAGDILVIPMDRLYEKHVVTRQDYIPLKDTCIGDLYEITRCLHDCFADTYREAINKTCGAQPQVDWDPDVLWDEYGLPGYAIDDKFNRCVWRLVRPDIFRYLKEEKEAGNYL